VLIRVLMTLMTQKSTTLITDYWITLRIWALWSRSKWTDLEFSRRISCICHQFQAESMHFKSMGRSTNLMNWRT